MSEADQSTEPIKPEKIGDNEDKENKDCQKRNAKKESSGKPPKSGTSEESGGVSVKGLSNLGNTCFFNAVIQVRLSFIGFILSLGVFRDRCPKAQELK